MPAGISCVCIHDFASVAISQRVAPYAFKLVWLTLSLRGDCHEAVPAKLHCLPCQAARVLSEVSRRLCVSFMLGSFSLSLSLLTCATVLSHSVLHSISVSLARLLCHSIDHVQFSWSVYARSVPRWSCISFCSPFLHVSFDWSLSVVWSVNHMLFRFSYHIHILGLDLWPENQD